MPGMDRMTPVTPQKPMRIITLAEREAIALSERRSAIAEAQKRLAAEAPLHNGRYLVFGSAARGDIHARSDLDLLAEFPRANVGGAMLAAERICRALGIPCDVLDKARCNAEFLSYAMPGSRGLG